MAVHKWRRRQTEHFGEVWIPFAQVDIQGSDGRFQAFSLQIDSGAVVSLLRRSVADLLGLDLEAGRRIELTSVGGGDTAAHVHELQARFADGIAFPVPFAIAETESVPNLLGRRGVFDRLQIDFDATLDETRITTTWLDPKDQKLHEFVLLTEKHILERWADVGLPPPADKVAARLVTRGAQLVAAALGLMKLHHTWAGLPFVRSLFELALQVEYLMQDPVSRAQRYLDFGHVTKYLWARAIVDKPEGVIGRHLASSSLRPEGMRRLEADFTRVRDRFMRKDRKGKEHLSRNWHGMSMAELANKLGRRGEYRLLYKEGSAWAHCDPSSTEDAIPVLGKAPSVYLFTVLKYHARVLLLVSNRIILTADQYDGLEVLAKGLA